MSGRGRGRGRGRGGAKVSVSKELLKRSAAEAGLDDRHLKVLTDITHPPLYPDFLWHSDGAYWVPNPTKQQRLPQQPLVTLVAVKSEPLDEGEEEPLIPSQQQHSSSSSGPLLPELSRIKRPAGMVFIMNKQRELAEHLAGSAYYVPPTAPQDVARYRSSSSSSSLLPPPPPAAHRPDLVLLEQLSSNNRKLATDERYFPTELLVKKQGKTRHELLLPHLPDEIPSMMGEKLLLDPVTSDTIRVKREDGDNEDPDEDEEEDFLDELGGGEMEPEEEGADYVANYYDSDVESAGDDDAEPTY